MDYWKIGVLHLLISVIAGSLSTDLGVISRGETLTIQVSNLFNLNMTNSAILFSEFNAVKIIEPPLIPMTGLSSKSKIIDPSNLKHTSERELSSLSCSRILSTSTDLLAVGCFNNLSSSTSNARYPYIAILDSSKGTLESILDYKECLFSFKAWSTELLICKSYVLEEGKVEVYSVLIEINYKDKIMRPFQIISLFNSDQSREYSFKCISEDERGDCSYISLRVKEGGQTFAVLNSILKISSAKFELIQLDLLNLVTTIDSKSTEFSFVNMHSHTLNDSRILLAGSLKQNGLISTIITDCRMSSTSQGISDCRQLDLSPRKTQVKQGVLVDTLIAEDPRTNKIALFLVFVNLSYSNYNSVVVYNLQDYGVWEFERTSYISTLLKRGGFEKGTYYDTSYIKIISPLQFEMRWKFSSVPNILITYKNWILSQVESVVYFRGYYAIQKERELVWTVFEDKVNAFSTLPSTSNSFFYELDSTFEEAYFSSYHYHIKLGLSHEKVTRSLKESSIRISGDLTYLRNEQIGVFSRVFSTKYPNRMRLSNLAISGALDTAIRASNLTSFDTHSLHSMPYIYFSQKTGLPINIRDPIVLGSYLLSEGKIRKCIKQILKSIEMHCEEANNLDFHLPAKFNLTWIGDLAVFDYKQESGKERGLQLLNLVSGESSYINITRFGNSTIRIILPEEDYLIIAGFSDTSGERTIEVMGYRMIDDFELIAKISKEDDIAVLCAINLDISFEDTLKVYFSSLCDGSIESRRYFTQITIVGSEKIARILQQHSLIDRTANELGICGFNNTMLHVTNKRFLLTSFSDDSPIQYNISLKPSNSHFKEITSFYCLHNGRIGIIWDDVAFVVLDMDSLIYNRFYPYRSISIPGKPKRVLSNMDELIYVVENSNRSLESRIYPINIFDQIFSGELNSSKITLEAIQQGVEDSKLPSPLEFNLEMISGQPSPMNATCIINNCRDISKHADANGLIRLDKIFKFQGPKGDFSIKEEGGEENKEDLKFKGFYETQEIVTPNDSSPIWIASINEETMLIAFTDNEEAFKTNIFKLTLIDGDMSLTASFPHSCNTWGSRVFFDSIIISCKGIDSTSTLLSIAEFSLSGILLLKQTLKTTLLQIHNFDKIGLDRCYISEACITLVLEYTKREEIHIRRVQRLNTAFPKITQTAVKRRVSRMALLDGPQTGSGESNTYLVYFDTSNEKVLIQILNDPRRKPMVLELQNIGLASNSVCYSCKGDTCVCGAHGHFVSLIKVELDSTNASFREINRFAIYKNLEIDDIKYSGENLALIGRRIKDFEFKNKLWEIDVSGIFIYDIPQQRSSTLNPIDISSFISGARLHLFKDRIDSLAILKGAELLAITTTRRLMKILPATPCIHTGLSERIINLTFEPGNGSILLTLSPEAPVRISREEHFDRDLAFEPTAGDFDLFNLIVIYLSLIALVIVAFFSFKAVRGDNLANIRFKVNKRSSETTIQ